MTKKKKIIIIVVGVLLAFTALGVLFSLNSAQVLRAVGLVKPVPVFEFNQSIAPDWWAAENYNSQASAGETYEGIEPIDKLPVAGMTVFKGKKGEYTTACFAMISYYDYKADTAQLRKDKENEVKASATMKRIGEDSLTLKGLKKDIPIMVTNYELIGPEAENSMKGMSYGWADVGNGFIRVDGVCPVSAELKEVSTAIQAISLVEQ